jgi:hypothetical protein
MKRLILALLCGLLGLAAAACLPIQAPLAHLPTDTPLPPTQTPTATIVWFPPTPTTTPLPTTTLPITPTLDTRPVHGELLFEDQFSGDSQWSTGRTGSGTITLGNSELTLAVSRAGGSLTSLRSGTRLGNFYVEITASPTICRGGDEYGLLLRTSPGGDFYRFSLTCDGQTRLDKFFQGKASSPQGLTLSGSVPRGAPSVSRLAVLANDKELHFYINGDFLFSVRDPSLVSGGLGVFARSDGDNPVTVNFSDLKVYQSSDR